MNFIDKTLEKRDSISADDFLQSMADIYKEPHVKEKLTVYPQFVRDIIHIIEYDTELQMEGLSGFFTDSTKNYYQETYTALINCGAVKDAEILREAEKIDPYGEEEIYDEYEKLEEKTYLRNDWDSFWDLVRKYIEKNI